MCFNQSSCTAFARGPAVHRSLVGPRGFVVARVRTALSTATLVLAASVSSLGAQASTPAIPSAEVQVAAATLPLPEGMRAGAAVLGYRAAGRLEVLRQGTNDMRCLADDPAEARFHVACYHKTLEPFMERGRALRASGVTGPQVDTVRFAEVSRGALLMPSGAASLYNAASRPALVDVSRHTEGAYHVHARDVGRACRVFSRNDAASQVFVSCDYSSVCAFGACARLRGIAVRLA